MDTAAYWAHAAIMNNHGQNCCAGSRTFVQDTVYDEFVKKCVMFAENRCVGDPFDDMTQQGPQVILQSRCVLFFLMNIECLSVMVYTGIRSLIQNPHLIQSNYLYIFLRFLNILP